MNAKHTSRRFSKLQLVAASVPILSTGIVWTILVFYRLHAKHITGELDTILIAALGTGFGFTTLLYAVNPKMSALLWLLMGLTSSTILAAGLAYGTSLI